MIALAPAEKAELAGLEASAMLYVRGLSVRGVEHIPSPVEWTAWKVARMRKLQGGGPVSVFVPKKLSGGVSVLLVEAN